MVDPTPLAHIVARPQVQDGGAPGAPLGLLVGRGLAGAARGRLAGGACRAARGGHRKCKDRGRGAPAPHWLRRRPEAESPFTPLQEGTLAPSASAPVLLSAPAFERQPSRLDRRPSSKQKWGRSASSGSFRVRLSRCAPAPAPSRLIRRGLAREARRRSACPLTPPRRAPRAHDRRAPSSLAHTRKNHRELRRRASGASPRLGASPSPRRRAA